jgi:hypothetical protein
MVRDENEDMRTERKLMTEFITVAGALLVEYFTDRELKTMQDNGDKLFLFVETSGRVFKGVRCIRKDATGKEEQLFSLTEREGDGNEG